MLTDPQRYVERGDVISRFFPLPDRLYLPLARGGGIVELTARHGWWIDAALTEDIHPPFPVDEDDEFCVSSLWSLLLGDVNQRFTITHVVVLLGTSAEGAGGRGIRRLIVRLLGDGGTRRDLLIDPEYIDGLRVTDASGLSSWKGEARARGEDIVSMEVGIPPKA